MTVTETVPTEYADWLPNVEHDFEVIRSLTAEATTVGDEPSKSFVPVETITTDPIFLADVPQLLEMLRWRLSDYVKARRDVRRLYVSSAFVREQRCLFSDPESRPLARQAYCYCAAVAGMRGHPNFTPIR